MAVPHGKMFILVDVSKHREAVGEIVNHLITNYGTPISMVDSIEKICPKCCVHPSETPSDSSSSTSIAAPICPPSAEEQIEETTSSGTTSSTTTTDGPPEPKKTKLDEEFPILKNNLKKALKEEEEEDPAMIIIDEKTKEAFGTVLAVMQNGSQTNNTHPSEHSSDDGASNSMDNYECDEDDYVRVVPPRKPSFPNEISISQNSVPWADSSFLANFITSQPNIFHATNGGGGGSAGGFGQKTKTSPQTTQKERPPPIVSASGKTRRGRIVYSQQELNILEKYYEEDPNACANPTKRDIMCQKLDIDYHRLKVWFQNRRRKDKVKSQEDATGGHSGGVLGGILIDF